jgi:phosphatidylserine/phosphatidylglycerophosphate/cardiolipin synthase-like enzyme
MQETIEASSWDADSTPIFPAKSLLQPGITCWRIERAGRFAQIIDAADYFAVLKAAMLQARHSIYLIGWDFDTRTQLEPAGATQPGPNRLGNLINWIVKRRPGLQVYILPWRLGLVRTLVRGTTAFFILKWIFHRRVHFQHRLKAIRRGERNCQFELFDHCSTTRRDAVKPRHPPLIDLARPIPAISQTARPSFPQKAAASHNRLGSDC